MAACGHQDAGAGRNLASRGHVVRRAVGIACIRRLTREKDKGGCRVQRRPHDHVPEAYRQAQEDEPQTGDPVISYHSVRTRQVQLLFAQCDDLPLLGTRLGLPGEDNET